MKHDPAGDGLDFPLSPSRALVGEPVELIDTHMTIKGTRPTVQEPASAGSAGGASRRFALGLVRAFGGAILFSFPMLMTMEMWWLGFYMDPLRLALFILLAIPLLVGLSYYAGFEPTSAKGWGCAGTEKTSPRRARVTALAGNLIITASCAMRKKSHPFRQGNTRAVRQLDGSLQAGGLEKETSAGF